MNEEKKKGIAENLVAFVNRVLTDKNASPAEIAILPEMVRLIVEIRSLNTI